MMFPFPPTAIVDEIREREHLVMRCVLAAMGDPLRALGFAIYFAAAHTDAHSRLTAAGPLLSRHLEAYLRGDDSYVTLLRAERVIRGERPVVSCPRA